MGFFHQMLWKNLSKLFRQHDVYFEVHLLFQFSKKEGFPFIKTAKNTENFKVGEITFLPKSKLLLFGSVFPVRVLL